MPFDTAEIERERLRSILAAFRLVNGRIAPIPLSVTPSEWTGWQVVNPEADRQAYAARADAGLCTRCGKYPPRIDRKTCARCAEDQARRGREHRDRKRGGPAKTKGQGSVSPAGAARRAAARWRKKRAGRTG